jgi:hypothetical protein
MERQIETRKAELGIVGTNYVAVNAGRRRTDSKRALLEVIRDTAQAQGRQPKFKANF